MNYTTTIDGIIIKTSSYFEGLHWLYTDSYGNTLSVICHYGSYGREKGLFEIMASWTTFEDSAVIGHLTFGEVQEYIDELKGLNKKGVIKCR